jgi:hypothetical protein
MERLTEVKDKEIQLLNQQKALEHQKSEAGTDKKCYPGFCWHRCRLSFLFIWLFILWRKAAFDSRVTEVEMKALPRK